VQTSLLDAIRLCIALMRSPDRQWYSVGLLIRRACDHVGIWQEHITNSELVRAIKRLGRGKP
jgi:hypothetical protein